VASELLFLIPVFNDWSAVSRVLAELDAVAGRIAGPVAVLVVDDGSTDPAPSRLSFEPHHLIRVEVLPVRRNLGHQRAIALGLTFAYEQRPCRAVVVMDGDGQDAADDVPKLLAALDTAQRGTAVFAARTRRSEGPWFAAGYAAYKAVHRLLTGRKVEVGNFSVLPWSLLERLVGVSEIWNHYAAAVYKARLPVIQVPVARSRRIEGRSRMNFVALVTHGLSAISVYGEIVGVRMLCLAAALTALTLLAIAAVGFARIFLQVAIPSWAGTAVGLLIFLLTSLLLVLAMAVLFLLQARERYSFLPLRDYRHYLLPEWRLHG
jgi:glycosyltransferase involved in cell wall biosynthesis